MMPLATVLHLSDPQFGRHHRFGTEESFETLQSRLQEDLRGLREDQQLGPDLVIVTGDLAEWGRKTELDDARRFLEELTDFLGLGRDRVVVVPGNHDVNRPACEAYFKECEADEVEPAPPFWPKWKHYARFFHTLYPAESSADFTEDEPWSLFEIPELQVVVAGLNSTMAESHREDDHYGWLGEEQLHWFRDRLAPYREKGWLRIAAVHHNVVRGAVEDDENLRDADDLKRILGPCVNLVLHGHTHDGKLHWHDPQTPIISTGSAALKPEARPAEVPNQYQVIQIWEDRFCRWTRGYAPDRKSWIGDNRASADGSQWWDEQPLQSEVTLAPRLGPKRPDPDDLRFEARDDFLSRVETVCRLREKDAEIRRLRTGSPPVEYLRVSVEKDGIVRCYPVGAIGGDLNPESFDAFLAVSRRYQRTDQGLISTLVYGGEPPAEETVRRARAERVRLRSFTEYQGLLDFRGYVEKQTRKLAADRLYPPSLYVPQRMRFSLGQEERNGDDALAAVNEWLADSYGRFVLVLGDFGTGKTFLLHELARRMGEKPGSLAPILIEMRALEKSHRLDGLVAQHLAHSGMERIDLKAFHYMLEEGRIALLFDGFDELALRVTYDRAAEHFSTLVEAARGEAKVVVTSRTQHFESDRQVKTALLERVELLSGHRIARLERFDEKQIRRFLVNRLGNEPEAEARLALLDEVKDLMGLAQNPRLLGFISELSEKELRAAKEKGGEITAAGLYQLLLDRWLGYEYERHQPRGAPPALTVEERWEVVTQLALRLWQRTERSVNVSELTEEVARAVEPLAERSLTEGVAGPEGSQSSIEPLRVPAARRPVGSQATVGGGEEDGVEQSPTRRPSRVTSRLSAVPVRISARRASRSSRGRRHPSRGIPPVPRGRSKTVHPGAEPASAQSAPIIPMTTWAPTHEPQWPDASTPLRSPQAGTQRRHLRRPTASPSSLDQTDGDETDGTERAEGGRAPSRGCAPSKGCHSAARWPQRAWPGPASGRQLNRRVRASGQSW